MGKFLSDMIELGIEAAFAIPNSKSKVSKSSEILHHLISGEEEISIEEFINMYDTRIHDFDTKKDDIKIMKKHDFSGVYIIHNCTKNIFLVGKSDKVLRKVDRQFRGYENGDTFKIRIIKFEDSNYDSIEKLEQEMKAKYGKYHFEKDNSLSKNKIKDGKNNNTKIIFFIFGFFIIMALFSFFMAYLFSNLKEEKIKITANEKDFIGVHYEQVSEKIADFGFKNIKCIPKNDLITGWINKEGTTDKVSIDGNNNFKKDDLF